MSKHPGPRSTPSATENGCVSSDPSGHTVSWCASTRTPSLPVAEPPAQVRAPVKDDQLRGGPEVPLADRRDEVRAFGNSIQNG